MDFLENIDIDINIDMDFLQNINIIINIDKGILKNIDIVKDIVFDMDLADRTPPVSALKRYYLLKL